MARWLNSPYWPPVPRSFYIFGVGLLFGLTKYKYLQLAATEETVETSCQMENTVDFESLSSYLIDVSHNSLQPLVTNVGNQLRGADFLLRSKYSLS
jgi:hypothetical protein